MIFFSTSAALKEYIDENNVITWNGCIGTGSLIFIDTSTLHVVFSSYKDYESWVASGRVEQLSLI